MVHEVKQLVLMGAVKHGGCQAGGAGLLREVRHILQPGRVALNLPALLGQPAGVNLKHLPDVHTAGHTQRVQDDVHGSTVFQERHILNRQDLGNNALIAVAARELIAIGDLTLLRHVHAHQLVHARGQIVFVVTFTVEDTNTDHSTGFAVRNLQGGIAHLAGLLTEDRAQQALLRGQVGLALGGDLTDQNVASLNFGTNVDHAALIQCGQGLIRDVGDITGDFLRPQLGVAGIDLVLLNVDGGQHVLGNHALGEDNRILIVQALPRHVCHEQVLAQSELATVGGGAVRDNVTLFHTLTGLDHNTLVVAVARVRAGELHDRVRAAGAVIITNHHQVSRDLRDHASFLRQHGVTGVKRSVLLHAGTHHGSLRLQQRHSLTLHVRTHQRAVRVVVLKVRDQGGCHRHHLARGNVHVLHVSRCYQHGLTGTIACTAENLVLSEGAVNGQRGVCLRNNDALLVISSQITHLVGDLAVFNHAVGGLNKAVRVNAAIGCQRTDQTNVRAFRGLNGAHTAVV